MSQCLKRRDKSSGTLRAHIARRIKKIAGQIVDYLDEQKVTSLNAATALADGVRSDALKKCLHAFAMTQF